MIVYHSCVFKNEFCSLPHTAGPNGSEASMAWMLEPVIITVKFGDEAMLLPDVQVDLWTNLAEAHMPRGEMTLSAIDAALLGDAPLTFLANGERCVVDPPGPARYFDVFCGAPCKSVIYFPLRCIL